MNIKNVKITVGMCGDFVKTLNLVLCNFIGPY